MADLEKAPSTAQRTVIKGAAVLTLDSAGPASSVSDILIRDGKIEAIAPDLDARDAIVIEASGLIAIPGFVDGHRHTWEGIVRGGLPDVDLGGYLSRVNEHVAPAYTPEDAYLGTLLTCLGALDAGVTTILDWAHVQNSPEHSDACIAALHGAGIRAVFGYGPGSSQDGRAMYPDDIRRIASEQFTTKDQLLTLGLATMSPEHVDYEVATRHFALARDVDALITIHAGLRGLGTPGQILRLAQDDLLGPDVNLVHCNTLSADEWRAIGDSGASVSITPSTEAQMGQGVPPFDQAMQVGVCPSLGIDVEVAVAGDMWTQMRIGFSLQRMKAFQRADETGQAPELVTSYDMLRFATQGGALATNLPNAIGSLTVGKQADIVLIRATDINLIPISDIASSVLHNADARNIDTVLVAGQVVKRGGQLVGVDLDDLLDRAQRGRDRVYAKAGMRPPDDPARRWSSSSRP